MIDGIIQSARNIRGVHDTRDQVVDFVNDHHGIIERTGQRLSAFGSFGNVGIDVLGIQTVVVDELESLSNHILDLSVDDILCSLGQILEVRILAGYCDEKLPCAVNESVGDTQRLGLRAGLVVECLFAPMLFQDVDRCATLAQLGLVILTQ